MINPDSVKIKIFADGRERGSQILNKLSLIPDIDLEIVENMELADYVLSDDMAGERKTAEDFLNSLVGDEKGKVLRQCRDIANEYGVAILFLECPLDELLSLRNIHANSIFGALQSIMESGCKVRFTGSPDGTVAYLIQKAREEQEGKTTVFSPHGNKTKRNLKEAQEYVTSSFDGVGGATGQKLLREYDSLFNLFNRSLEEMQSMKGINKPAMERFYNLLHARYKK